MMKEGRERERLSSGCDGGEEDEGLKRGRGQLPRFSGFLVPRDEGEEEKEEIGGID